MFNKNKAVQMQEQKHNLPTIESLTEKSSLTEAFNSLQVLDVSTIPQEGSTLNLQESVCNLNGKNFRTDYIMTPKKAVYRIDEQRIGIEADKAHGLMH